MSAASRSAHERINFRLDKSKKRVIERAAAIKGLSLTDFVEMTLYREASEVVESEEVVVLSDRDRDAFLRALDAPPKPPSETAASRGGLQVSASPWASFVDHVR